MGSLRVVVIGAGIGGLTAAHTLVRKGFDVSVIEQSPEIGEVGAGIQLAPNAMKVMRALGLEQEVAKVAFEPNRQVAVNWKTGRQLFATQLKGAFNDRFGAPFYQVHRADLHKVLSTALPHDRLRLGVPCVAVRNTPTAAVVTLQTGEEIEADVIVGADGIHSKVRESLFGSAPPRFTGNICWRGLVPTASLPKGLINPDSTIWLGPGGHMVSYYVRRGELVNFVASFESSTWTSESWRVEVPRDEVIEAFRGWDPTLQTLFAQAERCYKWGLFDRDPLPRWSEDRITLLGDAAHPMLPYLAQGGCMALEDAFALAEFLSDSPDDPIGALRRYEAVRRPRATRVQLYSRARANINHMRSPVGRFLRDAKMRWRKWLRPESTTWDIGWIYGYNSTSPDQLRTDLQLAA